MDENTCKREFDEWVKLLELHSARDLMQDPYNIWLEAWSVCSILKDNGKPH